MIKRFIVAVFSLMLSAMMLAGCEKQSADINNIAYENENIENEKINGEKIKIVATLFPQYDFARQISGDLIEVDLLLPPGSESHSYEPTPSDVIKLNEADIFLYTGAEMEPWADKIAQSLDDRVRIVNAAQGIAAEKSSVHEEDESYDDHDHEHEYDPHIWLNPRKAIEMIDNILAAICEIDPENAKIYRANADKYIAQIQDLDRDFEEAVNNAKRDTLVFGGRFAYQYFLSRYDLNCVSAYDSCSSEAEPSVREVSEVIEYMKANDVKVIYHEELANPAVAESIAKQTSAKMLLFSTCHNLTKDELEQGVCYIDIMRRNLENVKEGLK